MANSAIRMEPSNLRDRAPFDRAIDSKLRGGDVVKILIGELVSGGRVRARATVTQQKTGRPVQFELLEAARSNGGRMSRNRASGLYFAVSFELYVVLTEEQSHAVAVDLQGLQDGRRVPSDKRYSDAHRKTACRKCSERAVRSPWAPTLLQARPRRQSEARPLVIK